MSNRGYYGGHPPNSYADDYRQTPHASDYNNPASRLPTAVPHIGAHRGYNVPPPGKES